MDMFKDKSEGLKWGWRINLFTFFFSIFFYFKLWSLYPKFKEENPELFKSSAVTDDEQDEKVVE